MVVRGFNFHLVAIAQLCIDRHVTAVDEGTHCCVADVGMHRKSEIERRRPAGQRDETSLGREAENLVLEKLQLRVL